MLGVRWQMRNLIIGIILVIVTFIAGYFKGEYDKGVEVALQVTKANEASAEKEKQLNQVAITYATLLALQKVLPVPTGPNATTISNSSIDSSNSF